MGGRKSLENDRSDGWKSQSPEKDATSIINNESNSSIKDSISWKCPSYKKLFK